MPNKQKSPSSHHLGHKLRQAIDAKKVQDGTLQADVARHFKVKPSTVSGDWLKRGTIGKERYPDLVSYFGLPYEWWFGPPDMPLPGNGAMPTERPPEHETITILKHEPVAEVIELWEHVAPVAQESMLRFMRASRDADEAWRKNELAKLPVGSHASSAQPTRGRRNAVEKAKAGAR